MQKIIFILFSVTVITLSLSGSDTDMQTSSYAVSQETKPARYRISYESFPLSDTREMGMVGTHFDVYPFKMFKPFYVGLGFYSAASGSEGGFFTFGYGMGIDYPLWEHLHVDGGTYLGGGVGKYINFPNGGMIIRSHLSLSYEFNRIQFALGMAETNFPNSRDNKAYASNLHPYVGVTIPSDIWMMTANADLPEHSSIFNGLIREIRMTPSLMYYDIDNKPTKRTDYYMGDELYQSNFPLVGAQFDQFVTEYLFIPLEAYGAIGSAAGYAALHTGVGYDMPLTGLLIWENKLITGFAGDSRIDTKSGWIVQPMTGLRLQLTSSLSFKTMIGRTYAPTGTFSATTYETGLSWQAGRPIPSQAGTYLFLPDRFAKLKWSFTPSYKVYFPYDSSHKSSKEESEKMIGLVGLKLAFPLASWFSLVGTTHWAVVGNVGSYAEGLLGVQLNTPAFTPLDIKLTFDGEIGAGGGSGINTTSSGGYISQLLTGLEIPLTRNVELVAKAGRTRNNEGTFKADALLVGLKFNAHLLYEKR